MSYTHSKKSPVILTNDPIDPGDTDWVYLIYENWLRDGETITDHSAFVEGGTLETDSTYLGEMVDSEGVTFSEVYGVKFTAGEDGQSVVIKHRKSTTTTGSVDLGRLNIDHSAVIPINTL